MENKSQSAHFSGVRRSKRLSTNISVRVFLDDGQVTNGRGHDLGAGGMALYVPLDLPVGDVIKISFQLPYSRITFGVSATVRNCEGFRYGIEFIGLTQFELSEIERIVSILALTS